MPNIRQIRVGLARTLADDNYGNLRVDVELTADVAAGEEPEAARQDLIGQTVETYAQAVNKYVEASGANRGLRETSRFLWEEKPPKQGKRKERPLQRSSGASGGQA